MKVSVNGKECFMCKISKDAEPREKCGNFNREKTETCKEKDDGSCIKYNIRDVTYFNCESYGQAPTGSGSIYST